MKTIKHSLFEQASSILRATCIAVVFAHSSFAFAADKPKIESFFRNPAIQSVKLSPDGKMLTMLVPSPTTGYLQLFTIDLNNMTPKLVAGFNNADVGSYSWINRQRLLYSAAFHDVAQGEMRFFPGLFAVNSDGTERIELASPVNSKLVTTGTSITSHKLTGYTWLISKDKGYESDDVFVGQYVYDNLWDVKAVNLLRLNTKTGKSYSFNRPGNTAKWVIDDTGTPRINMTSGKGMNAVYYLDPANDQWRKLAEFSVFDKNGFEPFAFTPDGNLYVISHGGKDTTSLYRYDLNKNALDPEPTVKLDGYDFEGSLITDLKNEHLIGINHLTDAYGTTWLTPEWKALQKKIDDLLPGTINHLSFSHALASPYALIAAASDRQPVSYLLYNLKTDKLQGIGDAYPDIHPKEMSHQEFIHYPAKDGLSIPAYLTLPVGLEKKNLPLIVLVHGGPYTRGSHWSWDPEVQFLASRGYAVLQPEFRGSRGFGTRHLEAGFKQWGLSMQEDLADGARWAIAQGYADPKRICIAGASYGGYATLMGLAKNPELFRCGVEWAGVTDIQLMYASSWENDASEEWQKYGMPVMIGDKIKDAEQLKATSPVNVASQIRQPLLMAYGSADRRVPIEHGKKFRDAVAKTNQQVEWIQYDDEGHGWKLVKNRVDFWNRVEKFLEKNLPQK